MCPPSLLRLLTCRYGGFSPISPLQYQGFRDRMADCLGFPAAARAPLQPPSIMLVDRRYSQGRALLNSYELLQALRRRYGGGSAEVRLEYMEGMSLR